MWALFDLNGTLVDPGDPAVLDDANMMAMVTVITGAQAEFKTLLEAALQRAGRDPRELDRMPAYPDVPDALARLREAGFRLAVLTQSAADAAETVLVDAGLREHFEHVLSAPDAGTFKPEDLAYRAALEKVGAGDAWFVAGHWWDVAGAAYAGLRTAWISRTELAYPAAMPPPDVRGADLAEVVAAITSA